MRVALIADLVEEGWPSMDLVAEMLAQHLRVDSLESDVRYEVELIRPAMRRRFSNGNQGIGFTVDRALNRLVDYPRLVRAKRNEFELFHIVDHSYSQLVHELPSERTIVTCHDLDTFRSLWNPERERRGQAFRIMTRRILNGLGKAAHVCCDSAATRAELVDRGIVPESRTSIVRLGVHPAMALPASAAVENRVDALLQARTEPDPIYLLHVGSTIARKRIDLLLEIFARLRATYANLLLVRVGGPFEASQDRQVERLGIRENVRVLPFLSVAELAAVYRRAALLVLPSEAEGFGLPVIEAMANGTVVLASDLPVLREVGGDAAEYARIGDVNDWALKATALLHEHRDSRLRELRRSRCRAQVAKFSWTETATRLVEIYDQVSAEAGMKR